VGFVDGNHAVVLLGRFLDRDRPVAQALAREFGRDEAWGLAVVNAAPIALVGNLSAEQALAVREALADVEIAGSKLETRSSLESDMAKLDWPTPPRLRGRLVSELGASGPKFTANLMLPCPYTGQKMKLTLSVSVSRAGGETSLNVAAAATQVAAPPVAINAPIPLPAAQPMIPAPAAPASRPPSRGNQIPPHHAPFPGATQPGRQVNAPIPVPTPQHAPRPAAPVGQGPMIIGLESLEELTPMQQYPAEVQHEAPRPVQQRAHGTAVAQRSPGGGIPLPDVPVLHNQPSPPRPVSLPEVPSAVPTPNNLGAPMDLEVFEQKVSSSGIFRAPAPEELQEVSDEESVDANICAVFMGKTNNARAHQVLAEVQGISVPEAAKLCQRAIVSIAKDISEADAAEIKQRFAAANVAVRITRKQ
jgi:hypothetical protein